jgi:hypothetical protein
VLRVFRGTTIKRSLLVSFLSAALASSTDLKLRDPASPATGPATVWQVKLLLEKDSPVVEIMSTRPMRPVITTTQEPRALSIYLNNAQVSVHHRQVTVQSPLIGAVRIDQLEQNPPIVRIILGERTPLMYTWDAAGNRLSIRLHEESESARAKPTSATVLTSTPEPVAVPASPAGKVMYLDRLSSGSSYSANFATETLRLSRGGEVRVCPGTTISVSYPKDGPELMLGMSVGALETHYALEDSADSIVTPDFRILLRGPGEFHYAIRADSKGNTCIRSLPGNTAPVIVYEAIGNGQFEVVPNERLLLHSGQLNAADTAFHSGQLTQVETLVPADCGCPPPVPVLRAELPAPPTLAKDSSNVSLDPPSTESAISPQIASIRPLSSNAEIAALTPLAPNQSPVELQASLVFTRKEMLDSRLVDLPISKREIPALEVKPPSVPQPPAQTPKKAQQRGLFRKVKRFFSRIFS